MENFFTLTLWNKVPFNSFQCEDVQICCHYVNVECHRCEARTTHGHDFVVRYSQPPVLVRELSKLLGSSRGQAGCMV